MTTVPAENSYTVTSHKSEYTIKSITQQTDENGDLHIYVEFVYDPNTFDFIYYVELDEELQTLVEIPKEDDNQIRAAIDVLLEGEEAVKEKLEAEAKVKEQETAAAD